MDRTEFFRRVAVDCAQACPKVPTQAEPRMAFCPACFVQVSAAEADQQTIDARRYRWLREQASVKTPHVLNPVDGFRCFSEGLDAVIDAAMRATGA